METVEVPSEKQLEDTYVKTFRMQATGADGQTTRVSVPRDVVRKEAKKHKLSVKQFLEQYRIEWRFNSFAGAYALFVPVPEEKKGT